MRYQKSASAHRRISRLVNIILVAFQHFSLLITNSFYHFFLGRGKHTVSFFLCSSIDPARKIIFLLVPFQGGQRAGLSIQQCQVKKMSTIISGVAVSRSEQTWVNWLFKGVQDGSPWYVATTNQIFSSTFSSMGKKKKKEDVFCYEKWAAKNIQETSRIIHNTYDNRSFR